jgi:hypothetical protein
VDWGPAGPPDEFVEVPESMRDPDPRRNLKWRVIERYESQIDCEPDRSGRFPPSCGYLRAFVKRHEFFWRTTLGTGRAASDAADHTRDSR